MSKLYEFCDRCVLKYTCRHLTGEMGNANMLHDFCMPFRMAEHNFKLAGVPSRFKFANINDFKDNPALFSHINDLLALLYKGSSATVFYYSSETGTGKSHCAATTLNSYLIYKLREIAQNKGDIFPEEPLGYFIDYAYLIDMLRDRYKDGYAPEAINYSLNVPLLVLDDVGSGKMSEYAREQTNILINNRYSKNLSTIITSNLSLDELATDELLGKRAVSRIRDGAIVIGFNYADRREVKFTTNVN